MSSTRNPPRSLSVRLDPINRRPTLPHPAWPGIVAAANQFSNPANPRSRARNQGHSPNAWLHVENFLIHAVLGWTRKRIAEWRGLHSATIAESVNRGRALVQAGADASGFTDPAGVRFARDPEAPWGWRCVDADPWALDDE